MSDFYNYFKENMDSLGLPAPATLFGSLQAAVGNAAVILSQIDKFGKSVTIAELVGAGTKLEGLATVGACSAAFYVGAVIGSIAVATGRSLSGGTSIADVITTAHKYSLSRPWLTTVLQCYPALYDRKAIARNTCHYQAVVA